MSTPLSISSTSHKKARSINGGSLKINRHFSTKGQPPYETVTWKKVDALIPGKDKPAFEQKNVEFPEFYSTNAINIIASKYFRGHGTERESSLKQIIDRVVTTFRGWGEEQGYFRSKEEAQVFADELTSIILTQRAWFNSPVWFNVGIKPQPQCSACFILSLEDNMDSILDWLKIEGIVFKNGSGSGVALSKLRAENEPLSVGGSSSGPISFMRAADAVAGSIKSGGATRRAAKMVIMHDDHPDIMKFVRIKAEEEDKIRTFIEAGHDLTDMNHPLWQNIAFQNANNSIRLSDTFMESALRDSTWQTTYRTTGAVAETFQAKDLLWEAARAAWACGDPGVQYEGTIHRWHTCKNSGRIMATNPCAEYVFLNDTSCNLASINLLKYLDSDGRFDVAAFLHTVRIMFLAQDILIDRAGYPTPHINEESRKYRTIGLGYANLGALLMSLGIPYDSEQGRSWAGVLTALMTGEAYRTSTLIAQKLGTFKEFEHNREPALQVMRLHQEAAQNLPAGLVPDQLVTTAQSIWDEVVHLSQGHGLRNAQATVIAPTGTIGLAMDCTTTGVEPDFALVKMKQLVGGGYMMFVNPIVEESLRRLQYSEEEIKAIVHHLEETQNIETAPYLKEEHLPVFDTAVKPIQGSRSIHWMGHVRMVAAVQPFVSGAISKTFNMPSEATIEDIYNAYVEAWKLGIKCFALYRDGSKATQALYSGGKGGSKKEKEKRLIRRRLPDTRQSETHKFEIGGHEGYLSYSMFEDGTPGEIFITMAKQGSTLAGLLDAFAITISVALQYGVPLRDLVRKLSRMRFDPMGLTSNPDIRFANSIIDYIFTYLARRFLSEVELVSLGLISTGEHSHLVMHPRLAFQDENDRHAKQAELSGPPCKQCGGMTVRTGTCYTCLECGESSGGCG